MRRSCVWRLGLLVITLALALTACTSRSRGPARLIGVVVSPSEMASPLFRAGLQERAAKAGVSLQLASAKGEVDQEAHIIDSLIARGAEAIIVTPVSAGSLPSLRKAQAAGIAVICFKVPVGDPQICTVFVSADERELGSTDGDAALKPIIGQNGGQAALGLVTCSDDPACGQRRSGFLARVKLLPGVRVLDERPADTEATARAATEAMLQEHPEISFVWAATQRGTVGAAAAIESLGLAGKVQLLGTGVDSEIVGLLQSRDGILQGAADYLPYQEGAALMEIALAARPGEGTGITLSIPPLYLSRDDEAQVQAYLAQSGKLPAPALVVPVPAGSATPSGNDCHCLDSPAHPVIPTPE